MIHGSYMTGIKTGKGAHMKTKASGLSISVYFGICFGLIFIVASIFVIAIVNREMRNKAFFLCYC